MKRSSRMPKDPNQLAAEIVRLSTEETAPKPPPAISAYLAQIGRTGGLKGGRARANKLSSERKIEIARKAAKARWKTNKKR
jgi:hypothetical protein